MVLTGLTDGPGYDVQVRAVTDVDGAWSATVAGTPAEPGDTFDTALTLPLDITAWWRHRPEDRPGHLQVHVDGRDGNDPLHQGDTDTFGVLFNEDGDLLDANDDGLP